ncbi:MAG: ATP-binding protein [Candidatus Margulisiibacteriota bacterium]|mgnify:CR=1 FL=1
MKIKSLKLENIKCFDSLELKDLDSKNLIIFAGENGSGKSSIFDVFNLVFAYIAIGSWSYGANDLLQNGKNEGSIEAHLVLNEDERSAAAFNEGDITKHLQIKLKRNESLSLASEDWFSSVRENLVNKRYNRDAFESEQNIRNIGVYIHRSPYRYEDVGDIKELNRGILKSEEDKNRLKIQAQEQSSRWQIILSYLLQLDRIKNKKGCEVHENVAGAKAAYSEAKMKIESLTDDFNFLLEGKKFDKISEDTNAGRTCFWIKNMSTDQRIELKQLSSGEKEALFLLSDIRRQEPSHSVIAVDEPELHLHYSLQKKLVERFSALGAENQVFLTTHSLAIVRSAMSEKNSTIYYFDSASNYKEVKTKSDFMDLYKVLADDLAGVLANEVVVFVEGENSEKDALTYGALFDDPKVNFISAKNRDLVSSAAWLALHLVTRQTSPQRLFAIVDGDGRSTAEREKRQVDFEGHLFVLPAYSLESLFFDFELWEAVDASKKRNNFRGMRSSDLKSFVKGKLETNESIKKAAHKIFESRKRIRPTLDEKTESQIESDLKSTLHDGSFVEKFPMKEFMGELAEAVFSFGNIEDFKVELIGLMKAKSKISRELSEFIDRAKS